MQHLYSEYARKNCTFNFSFLYHAMPNHLTLSELNGLVQAALNSALGSRSFWIVADVTEHSYKDATGYHYFEFVEKDPNTNRIVAKIKGSAWGNASQKIMAFETVTGRKFTNNMHVLARVRVNYHKVYGLSLELEEIDPHFTLGVIEAKRQETLRRLVSGYPDIIELTGSTYVTRNGRMELPPVISRLAVISSETSAGNEDFKHTLVHNPYGYRFEVDDYFTSVQNEANAHLLLSKLLEVYHSGLPYDAVVINRGGGSQTDFLIFDDFKIGLAIAKFPIPVITGIGHQKNETIADLMAHTNTKTPTKAAEFIITHNKAFEDRLVHLQKQIILRSQAFLAKEKSLFCSLHARVLNQSRTLLERNKGSLSNLEHRFTSSAKGELNRARRHLDQNRYSVQARPQVLFSYERRNLTEVTEDLAVSTARLLSAERAMLKNAVAMIRVISPENILRKGFAIVKKNNEITSDPGQFAPESEIEIILRNKSLRATINTNTEYHGNDFNLPESL